MQKDTDAGPAADPEVATASSLAAVRRIALAVAAFLVAAVPNAAIQLKSTGFTDPDGYYHIRWSRVLWEGLSHGRLPHFVWLPLTILNERDYADHHFLFHVLQIPFTWAGDLVAGAKVSAVLYGTLAYLSCYALVVWARVRYRFVWLVLLVASSLTLLARMSLPRAPAVMVILLAATAWLLMTRRYRWLAALAFVAVWTYSLFPLVGVFAIVWAAAVRLEEHRLEWRPVVLAAGGIAAGLVINPYFPQNVHLLLAHLTKALPGSAEVVGNEWAPLTLSALVTQNAVALAAQVLGACLLLARVRRADARAIFLGVISVLLLALALRSARFVEYWAPFSVVFLAFAAAPWLETWSFERLRPNGARLAVLAAGCMIAAAVVLYPLEFVAGANVSAIPSTHPEVYRGLAQWLATNTPEGSVVYNVSWEDFPALFCFDTHNVYVAGLDPTYLSFANPDLGRLYDEVGSGQAPNPGAVIRDRFGARYVVATAADKAFLDRARTDPSIKLAYSSPLAIVLVIGDGP